MVFDIWYYGQQTDIGYSKMKKAFEAGQQSKQAEVDELQKRIDEALHEADESCGVSVDAFVKLNKILKGNTNDH